MRTTFKTILDFMEESLKDLDNRDPLDVIHKLQEELELLEKELKPIAEGAELPHIISLYSARGRRSLARELLELPKIVYIKEPGK